MVSVVIPAYNEGKILAKCLNAFVNQKTSENFEVIVVDNNSTDNTLKIAHSYKTRLNLIIVSEKKKGRGAARKKGFLKTRGDIILSTDADTIIPPNWIESIVKTLRDSRAVAVTGTSYITDLSLFSNTIFNFLQPLSMRGYRLFFRHYWLTGCNFAIYKRAYEKSGGFNENLNVQEDTELSFRVRKIGDIKFVPDLPVLGSGRRLRKGLTKGLFDYLSTYVATTLYKKDVILPDIR